VVITDTQIGETDGVDFLAAVREDYADVVPILLSDSKDASVAIRLINEGRVYRYLVKPFTRSLLKETVLAAMSQYQSYKKDPVINLRRFEESILAGTQMSEASAQSFADALLKARERIRSRTSY
ncbi:MAG: hypothetical protein IAF08_02530, partial [Rhizobacter sp.]|nr:hypothetical protein [Chlorobiales bacterium]